MRGFPLWQPYASLVVHGAKRIETRHWPAPPDVIGQTIAIYATKGVGPGGEREYRARLESDPFRAVLEELAVDAGALPRGAVIGTAVVARTTAMYPSAIRQLRERNPREFAFGHYAAGRFAWVLRDPVVIEPIPFEWPVRGPAKFIDVPDELLGRPPEQSAQGALL